MCGVFFPFSNLSSSIYATVEETRSAFYIVPSLHLHPGLHVADRFYRDAIRADPCDLLSLSMYLLCNLLLGEKFDYVRYGAFLSINGHYEEAVEYLLRLLQLDPNSAIGFANLRYHLFAICHGSNSIISIKMCGSRIGLLAHA